MRRLDTGHAVTFVNLESDASACPIDRGNLLARLHVSEDGKLLSGAAAFAAMWRAIPRLRLLGLAARNGLVLAVLEQAYRLFLRVRPRLQAAARRFDRKA